MWKTHHKLIKLHDTTDNKDLIILFQIIKGLSIIQCHYATASFVIVLNLVTF